MGTVASPSEDDPKIVMGYPPPPPNYVYPPQPDPAYHKGGYTNPVLPSPYPGQPYDGGYNYYHHQQPNNYYNDPLMKPVTRTASIGRAMISLLVVLAVGMCMLSIMVFLLFGTDTPGFRVVSLTVPNFNATNSSLMASWDANITVVNQNDNFRVQFQRIVSSVFYENEMLAISPVQPFQLGTNQKLDVTMRIRTDPQNQQELHRGVFTNIVQDRSTGIVFFSFRMFLKAEYISNSLWRKYYLKVNCQNLQISFSPTGEGKLTDEFRSECETHTR